MVRESFYAYFQTLQPNEPYDRTEYVGFILLYNSSSMETLKYVRDYSPNPDSADDFILLVEMDNSERKGNMVGEEGQEWSQSSGTPTSTQGCYSCDSPSTTPTTSWPH